MVRAMRKVFCCPGFEHRIANAGQRGLAILVRNTSEGLIFLLQSRGIAFEDEGKMKPVPTDIYFNISTTTGMRYCPACGTFLKRLIEASPEQFEKLAKEHEKFDREK